MKKPIRGFTHLTVSMLVLTAAHLASANTAVWIGVSGTSVTTNWSDTANWNNIGAGGAGFVQNDVLFGNTGAVATDNQINSVANVSDQAFSMTFTNQSGNFHTVLIPTGIWLTNNNGLTVGSSTGIDANNTKVNFTGGGTLVQKGNVTVRNNSNTSGSTSLATLDLSGLAVLVCSNSGTFSVGGTASEQRAAGALVLAGTSNNITTTTLNLQTTGGNGNNPGGASIKLGLGTNIINAGTINIVSGKAVSGTLNFLGGTGGVRIRGANGNADDTSRATITICNRNTGGTGGLTGTADFTGGHPVDIKAGTLTIATATVNPTSANQSGTGTLKFDAGTIDATTITMANNTVANANSTANLTVAGSGTLLVGTLTLVNQTAGNGTGNLTNAGTLQATGNIVKSSASGTANVDLSGGALKLVSGTNVLGTTAAPINSVTVSNSILSLPVLNGSATVVASTLNINGTADTINVTAVPALGSLPAQFPVITYTSLGGATATLDFSLGTIPVAYQGYISNNVANSSVDLVVTNSIAKLDAWNGNINGNWDTSTANWLNNSSPATYLQGDSVTFDDTATGTTSVTLTTNLLPGVISVNNTAKTYVFSGAGKLSGSAALNKQGTGTLTLSETGGDNFSGGIVVQAGSVILDDPNSAISGGLNVNSGATAQMGNNSPNGSLPAGTVQIDGSLIFNRTADLAVASPIMGGGSVSKQGSARLTLTVTNTYTGPSTVANGTLALTGSGSISSSSELAVSGAGFDVSGASGQTVLNALNATNATVTLAVSNAVVTPVSVSALSGGGAGNTINVTALPPIASYPVTLTVIQSASLISGFNFTLGTLPAGSPAYAGSILESADNMAVQLRLTAGPVGVRPVVFWSGADVPNLNTNWSDRLNWDLPGAPGAAESVLFNNTGAQIASALSTPGGGAAALIPDNFNNIVDANFSISSLTFTNTGGNYHNTDIASGRTLTVTNGLNIGVFDSGSPAAQETVTVSGGKGTLSVTGSNANFQVWIGSGSVAGSQSTLDLSALDTLNASVSRLLVGATINNVVNRPSGILYLAKTNVLSLGFQTTSSESGTTTANSAIVVGDCNQNNGSASYMYLGQANTISADTIGIGRQKAAGNVLFNPIYANTAPYPSLTLQGFSSGLVSILDVSDGAGNGGTTTMTATVDLQGGLVTAGIDTMNIGRASSSGSSSGTPTCTGVFTFDAGTITVNTLNLGLEPAVTNKAGVGTFGVSSNTIIGGGATLSVRGNLNLALAAGGGGAASTSGTLGVTNGTVRANAIVPGTNSQSTITMAGGRLTVTNVVGNSTAPLTTLNLTPLNTPDDFANVLSLPLRASSPSMMVTTLNLDALDTTTNIINVLSVGPIGSVPVELPLIQYGTMNFVSGATFNVGLGTMPTGYAGVLTNDTTINSIALVLTAAIHPQPVITTVSQSGTNLVISGVNGFGNVPYNVVASTNAALPLSQWTKVATSIFGPSGQFTATVPMTAPQQFYRLQVTP